MDIPRMLLDLAGSVGGDGGAGVLRTLEAILRDAAPFEVGELAVRGERGIERHVIGDEETPLIAEDLLFQLASRPAPVRFDDLPEADPFPRTRESMEAASVRSLLALPLWAPAGCEGALVVARRHGWGFVGAWLHALWPVAGMAGVCLHRALALTALRLEIEAREATAPIEAAATRPAAERRSRNRRRKDRNATGAPAVPRTA